MPHIPYADPAAITDPEILGYLERARKEGTPGLRVKRFGPITQMSFGLAPTLKKKADKAAQAPMSSE